MASKILIKRVIDIGSADKKIKFRATGSQIEFEGFHKLYREGKDDVLEQNEDGQTLPSLEEGTELLRVSVEPMFHSTKPLPRFTEASLVKSLEELGIGRPSTYASILSVLQDREYVVLQKKRFFPED